VIRAFSFEAQSFSEFQALADDDYEQNRKAIQASGLYGGSVIRFLEAFLLAAAILFYGSQFLNGVLLISIGALYATFDYITRLLNPLFSILNLVST